jgi:hypothetical protein
LPQHGILTQQTWPALLNFLDRLNRLVYGGYGTSR